MIIYFKIPRIVEKSQLTQKIRIIRCFYQELVKFLGVFPYKYFAFLAKGERFAGKLYICKLCGINAFSAWPLLPSL